MPGKGPFWSPEEDALIMTWRGKETYAQTAQRLGRSAEAIRIRGNLILKNKKVTYAAVKEEQPVLSDSVSEKRTTDKNSMTIEFKAPKRIHTEAELLEFCEVDLTVWEVDRMVCEKWEVGAKNKKKEIVVTELFLIKVWFKRNKVLEGAQRFIEMFEQAARTHAPSYTPITREESGEHIAIIPMADHHFQKLAWKEETGADYDLQIAEQLWKEAASYLLPRAKGYGLERIYLVVGNDLMNTDNPQGMTTSGTPQDNDTRIAKALYIAAMAFVWLIEQSRLVAPVEVIAVPGNHDALTSYMIAMFLWAWFRGCDDVTVDIGPAKTKFVEYGQNLIMLTHGDTIKLSKIALHMATEAHEAWGRTNFWEALTGHLHSEKANDYNGVIVRTCKALCAPDAWHKAHSYLGRRGAEAFIYHRETGPCGHLIYNVPK